MPVASADVLTTTMETTGEILDGARSAKEGHDRFQAARNEQELLDCLLEKDYISEADHKDFSDSSKARAIAQVFIHNVFM